MRQVPCFQEFFPETKIHPIFVSLQEAMDGGSEDAEGPEGLGIGLGGLLAERPDPEAELLEAARGRVRQMGGAPREAKRRRLSGWLQRRGYSWDVIKVVLAGAGV